MLYASFNLAVIKRFRTLNQTAGSTSRPVKLKPVAKLKNSPLEVIVVNDSGGVKNASNLLKYDSMLGTFKADVKIVDNETISVDGKLIKVVSNRDPLKLPWVELGIDIVIEGTGVFVDGPGAGKHIQAGAKKVIITAPAKGADIPTYVVGVNEGDYEHDVANIMSNASCTTNCLAPFVKVMDEELACLELQCISFGNIGLSEFQQQTLDASHRDLRRARAAALNIVPTSTGAAKAVSLVLPQLKGKLNGIALRVPTPNVSVVDLVVNVAKKGISAEDVNAAFRKAADGPLKGILAVCDVPLVSVDFRCSDVSSTIDSSLTMVMGDDMVKVVAWYDNEWGYSQRVVDLAHLVASKWPGMPTQGSGDPLEDFCKTSPSDEECIVWFFALFSAISGGLSNLQVSADVNREDVGSLNQPPTTSLLPITTKHNTALVAALDGTIYLVETNSRKILWSFPSGQSIYSSYQALPNHGSDNDSISEMDDFFIDCGDDWGLYVHGLGSKKVADGGVMVGSKNTTVFLVDAKSRTVINAFTSADHSAIGDRIAQEKPIVQANDVEEWVENSALDLEEVKLPLYVIRTDYAVTYFSRKTGKDLWSLRFAEIEASFRCQDASDLFGGVSDNSEDVFGPDLDSDDELPFNCQRRVVVYRTRDHSLLELSASDRLSNSHLGGRIPFLPGSEIYPLVKLPDKLPRVLGNDEGNVVLALPTLETEDVAILTLPRGGAGEMHSVAPEFFAGSHMWYLFVCVDLLSTVVAFIFHLTRLAVGKKGKLNKQSEDKVQAMMPRKKKS
ncbi:hypothetical protein Vadar_014075 [Vaccinium darrowii]|uniref:Uncharacterized protein n=1 Tax=Vaccinium darrowii TaxID=229202 RepID=A0ACB7Y6S8_9ERIC|nr:hypothetical protein Vadar_014075 [Vaccinium darrowii]